MPHFLLYEIYGTHFPHHLDAPLSVSTQEHFPALEVLLCWQYFVGSSVAEQLASLVDWQGAKGRKDSYIYFFRMLGAHDRDGQRIEGRKLVTEWFPTDSVSTVIPPPKLTPLLPERTENETILGDAKFPHFWLSK